MPGLDRTGPEGQGPRSGRGLGKCNPNKEEANESSNEEKFRAGKGYGRGRFRGGGGRGLGRGSGRNDPS